MTKLKLIIVITVAFISGLFCGTILERKTLRAWNASELNEVQAILAFNNLETNRELQHMLENSCISQASGRLDVAMDKDMQRLAEWYQRGQLSSGAVKYIVTRDPNLLEALKQFRSKYGESWIVADCKT